MDYHPGASAPFPLDEGQLRSILAQTHPVAEIVVGDDAALLLAVVTT